MTDASKDTNYIYFITNETKKHNLDNISRTNAYFAFYLKHPEIKWAFLASVVSRNAGWNMTDLVLPVFKQTLGEIENNQLFHTYEKANWLIFSDAYPQLLIYQLSTEQNEAKFHLLQYFNVSLFMIREWYLFWRKKDLTRMVYALIINEQYVIDRPIMQNNYYKKHVFLKIPYLLQNILRMNAVLLPTKQRELYGFFVPGFTKVENRIKLGKKIFHLLFTPSIYFRVKDFCLSVPHTGSRHDYEQFSCNQLKSQTVDLRAAFPVIEHEYKQYPDWYNQTKNVSKWLKQIEIRRYQVISKQFYRKRKLFEVYVRLKHLLQKK
ncbi:DUF2515 family protein [Virgibacillus soli]|uniref:DUF2515 family protein n=1 Tax=Paracerasibacillus soli TaxID=480284 RepID=A0ABU5CPK7_9BACI|nr:DUF2515 family protein [Virgibacillus soli]MDY0408289.1 DUF2515 family protein [Virgibacillus soli]